MEARIAFNHALSNYQQVVVKNFSTTTDGSDTTRTPLLMVKLANVPFIPQKR